MVISAVWVVALGGASLATPGSHVRSREALARASFVEPVDLKIKVGNGPLELIHVSNAKQTACSEW